MAGVDPFTVGIVREALVAASEEMFLVGARTSRNVIIYDVLDYACALVDAEGRLVAQALGIPIFLGCLTDAVAAVLARFGRDGLQPGDIVALNDPYIGAGTHLNDVVLAMPIFVGERLVGFSVSKAHWAEIGGKDPGSWSTNSLDIYQEGLQIPVTRLFVRGEPVEPLIALIQLNSRLPDMTAGDMYSQVASVRVGAQRVQEICERYGTEAVLASIDTIYQQTDRDVQLALARLPHGTFTVEDFIDDDGGGDEPIPVRLRLTIDDERMTIDLTGSGGWARRPINCTRTTLLSACRIIFRALTDPHLPVNDGAFRRMQVVCPEGTVFTATRPAPLGVYFEAADFAADLVWQALAPLVPELLPAGHFLSPMSTKIAGVHPDTGEPFILVDVQVGGWGAAHDADGTDALVAIPDGETYVTSIEVSEARYGVRIDRFSFNVAPGGEGRFRGGLGAVREYRNVSSQPALATVTSSRWRFPPWGVAGGRPGAPNRVEIVRTDGTVLRAGKLGTEWLQPGDVLRALPGSGGGWGDPRLRDPARVQADLEAGLITPEVAREIYGWRGPA